MAFWTSVLKLLLTGKHDIDEEVVVDWKRSTLYEGGLHDDKLCVATVMTSLYPLSTVADWRACLEAVCRRELGQHELQNHCRSVDAASALLGVSTMRSRPCGMKVDLCALPLLLRSAVEIIC